MINTNRMSHDPFVLRNYEPLATCHMPHATCHMPHATCHMPHATCHMPHATWQHPTDNRSQRLWGKAKKQNNWHLSVSHKFLVMPCPQIKSTLIVWRNQRWRWFQGHPWRLQRVRLKKIIYKQKNITIMKNF
jgi:hypothetical protein